MSNEPIQVNVGDLMYGRAADLFPICRSITGDGVRDTLKYIKEILPDLTIHEVPSGTQAFDWQVPDEWNIEDAYIADKAGNRIVDFKKSNLHVVGYSEAVDEWLTREELDANLHSLPEQPEAIPYITSYYQRRWGFCLSHKQRQALPDGLYHVVIKSSLEPGSLSYGELILPGRESGEILLSANICHPSMANNELSGPMVTMALAEWLIRQTERRYTYRIVFLPETIGSIVYLSRNLEAMRRNTVVGFVIACIGDDRAYSCLASRTGDTLADRVVKHTLGHLAPAYRSFSYLERVGDERQYCSPGVDLPVVSVMRSRPSEYPEYHTSLDDMSLISPEGLSGGYEAIRICLEALERNYVYQATTLCEPQLGKRGLYPTLGTRENRTSSRDILDVLTYADGSHDLIAIAERIGITAHDCAMIAEELTSHGLLQRVDDAARDEPVSVATEKPSISLVTS